MNPACAEINVSMERSVWRTVLRRPSFIVRAMIALAVTFTVLAERDLTTLPFVFACGAFIYFLAAFLTARKMFAACVAVGALAFSAMASMLKYKFLAVNAHVFDLRFYVNDLQTVQFLFENYRWAALGLGLALAAGMVALAWVYRLEQPDLRMSRRLAGALALASAVAAPLSAPAGALVIDYHASKRHFTSSFFASIAEAPHIWGVDPLTARIGYMSRAQAFAQPAKCEIGDDAPDIFLVLSESGFSSSGAPQWNWPDGFDAMLSSYDGRLHKARVEVHGGGTWVSHMSVMSGLSMADFGWMKTYSTITLKGRLRHSLPATLQACGYRTVAISPQHYRFVSEGPMLRSLGIMEYLDLQALRAPSKHEPDSFYFGKALELYAQHRREQKGPLFVFIATMSAHSPYDYRFQPERIARGEPFGNAPDVDEYLRRAVFAQEDYRAFIAAIDKGRDKRKALVAAFGDHQPTLTRPDLALQGAERAFSDYRSALYETYYSVTSLGFAPKAQLPAVAVLDLAYLGATLLEVAGLPLDPANRVMTALRDQCAGAFHTCANRSSVDHYLMRLARSGLVVAPGIAPAAKGESSAGTAELTENPGPQPSIR